MGQAGAVEFEISCPRFEILTLSCGRDSDFRIYVNGLLSETGFFRSGTDGAARWRMIDLTPISRWAECRSVRIQFLGGGAFGGLKLDRLGELHAPSAAKGLRLCVLGDSITKGAGAADPALGYAARLAWRLGFRDFLISGAEGTGWAQAYRPPGVDWFYPALKDRILQDGIQAEADVYVIAMGLTDLPGIQGAVETTLDRLRRGRPNAMIYVVGPWNPTPPQRPAGRLRAIGNEIKAAASARAGVAFLDPSHLNYTKIDIVHPDQQGHDTIGDWLAEAIKAGLGQP
jgi:lysophospholipase L1-like esterase